MAKDFENDFFKDIESKVEEEKASLSLNERKEVLERQILEMEQSPIYDPNDLKSLKDELAKLNRLIEKEEKTNGEKRVEDKIILSNLEEDEKISNEEEDKNSKTLNENETSNKDLENEYLNAMLALHETKIRNIKKRIDSNSYILDDESLRIEDELERRVYDARNKYLEVSKEDPYRELRTKHIKEEKDLIEPLELELRNKAKRLREIEEKIRKLDEREQSINEEMLNPNISDAKMEELQKELEEISSKRAKLETEKANVKEGLEEAVKFKQRRIEERSNLNREFESTLTYEDKRNKDYQEAKQNTMMNNFDKATRMHYENIKKRVDEREAKIKNIKETLKKTPSFDFERRLDLLNELEKETNMLEADKDALSLLDRGVSLDSNEAKKEVEENTKKEETRREEFDKSTENVREVIKKQDEALGAATLQDPEKANSKEDNRRETIEKLGIATAIVVEKKGGDDITDDFAQKYVGEKVAEKLITPSPIPGMERSVVDFSNPKECEGYLKTMASIDEKKAKEELERTEENIQKQTSI